MQIGMCSIQTYTKSLQHFIDKVNGRQMMLRTGHAENLEPFTEEYLDDLMNCAEGIIDGSIEPTVYPRRDASYASYGRANIVYYPYQIFDADFTDLNEAIQDAESRSSSKYTSDSWAKLQEAAHSGCCRTGDQRRHQGVGSEKQFFLFWRRFHDCLCACG